MSLLSSHSNLIFTGLYCRYCGVVGMQMLREVWRKEAFWVIALTVLAALLVSCGAQKQALKEPSGHVVGLASYYGHKFHGRRTASGERFNMNAMTAAHPQLAFGTLVRVTNLKNKRTIQVRVNDRGPFVKGRIIDLSYAAAKKIGMLSDGVVRVRITVVP